jgi:hypothetical protein
MMAAPDLFLEIGIQKDCGYQFPRSLHPPAGVKSAGHHIVLGQFSMKRTKSESRNWQAWFAMMHEDDAGNG